ncbi:MAG: VCBS repeat-containing protein, partial [Planctomycetaceae bacterium]|nr:VCBS repeat-containing protein [Planctomycetaceae bacterium]
MTPLHPPSKSLRNAPTARRLHRPPRRCVARVGLLETRTLLSGAAADVLATIATPIDLGSTTPGTLAPGAVAFFRIDPATDGRLVAQVHAPGTTTRLSLLNAQGQALMQSDGKSPANPDDLIDLHVPAGANYLEVENLGGTVAYTLTTTLTPASVPFQPIAVGNGPNSIVAGDFSGNGRIDLAVANWGNWTSNNVVSVLLGEGDGTFQNPVPYKVGSEPYAIVAGHFTGDGHIDLAVANYGDNTVSVLLGKGDGTFQNQVPYPVGNHPEGLVAGDFTGDGRIDLAVANFGSLDANGNPIPGTGSVSVLLGKGDGTFQNQVPYPAGTGPYALVAGDFTGDGHTDLAVANYGDNDVSVLLGNGDGTFQNQVTYKVANGPKAIVAGDFTGDGHTDLAVANYGFDDVSVLLGNGDGTFQN